jgi:hypothetical protein
MSVVIDVGGERPLAGNGPRAGAASGWRRELLRIA